MKSSLTSENKNDETMNKASKIGLTILIIIGYMLLFGIFPISILLCGFTVKLIKEVWAPAKNTKRETDITNIV